MQTVSSNIAGPSPALKQVYLPNSNAEVRIFRRVIPQNGGRAGQRFAPLAGDWPEVRDRLQGLLPAWQAEIEAKILEEHPDFESWQEDPVWGWSLT